VRALLNIVHRDDPLFRDASEAAIAIAEQISTDSALAEETETMMSGSPMMATVTGGGEHPDRHILAQRMGHTFGANETVETACHSDGGYYFNAACRAWWGVAENSGVVHDGIWSDRARKWQWWH